MQIWLDTKATTQHVSNECKGDCTREQPFSTITDIFSLSVASQHLRTDTLSLALSLYIQPCGQERWLVCSPSETGCIAVLDQDALHLLETFRTPMPLSYLAQKASCSLDVAERMVALFWRLGFLQDDGGCLQPSRASQPHTLVAWLHVTNACNLLCPYCYLHKTNEHMIDDTSRRAVNAIFRSARKQNFKQVTLKYAGGEASLHMAQVIAIHDYALQLAKTFNIPLQAFLLSNGVALSQRVIDMLKMRDIGVMISLDGVGVFHDLQRPFINGQASFTYVNRTIGRLLENYIVPHISVTISQRNLDGLPELIQYILDREMPFSLNYYRDNDCSTSVRDLLFEEQQMIDAMHRVFTFIEQHLPEQSLLGSLIDKASLDSMHRYTCGMGRTYLVIDQNGGVAKCHADIQRTITTVDVDDPLYVIQQERAGLQNLPIEAKEPCRTCTWRYWCTGGCPLLTYRATGRYDVKSPNCAIYKALFPEALHLEALRLLKYVTPIVLEEECIM